MALALTVVGLIVLCVVLYLTTLYRKHLLFCEYPSDGKAQFLLGHYFKLWGKNGIDDHVLHNWSEVCSANNLRCLERLPLSEVIPAMNWIITADPRDCEHILSTHFDNYVKGPMFLTVLEDLLGDGIFNSNGASWLEQRKAASHEFSVARFRDYMMTNFLKNAEDFCDILEKKCTDSATGFASKVDLQKLFGKYTLQSIGEIGFGVNLGCLSKDVPFEAAFDNATEMSAYRFTNLFWEIQRWLVRMGTGVERFSATAQREANLAASLLHIREFTNDVIRQRRELSLHDLDEKTDLLSRFMLLKTPEGKPYDDSYLRYVVTNFVIAGRDTTASCLSWLFYELARHPQVEEAVRQEISQTFGDSELARPTFADVRVTNMPYLHAVITESLRLNPPVPSDPKCAVKDDVLPSGIKVKAGWNVDYVPYCMARMTENWGEDCYEFKPERFLTPLPKGNDQKWQFNKPSPFKFSAFQAGKRLCLGVDMAYLEVKMAVILLLQRFKFELTEGFEHPTYYRSLTLPMTYLNMDITPLSK